MIDEDEDQFRQMQMQMQKGKAMSHEDSLIQQNAKKMLQKQITNENDQIGNDEIEMDQSMMVSDNQIDNEDNLMQANQPHYHSVIEETITFNMGTMDSRENGMNNKVNRKLKKNDIY